MQISPPIPFVDATQNNVKHPNDLKPGTEFVRLTMYTGEHDPVPSWPWPTYTGWGVKTTVGGEDFYGFQGTSTPPIPNPYGLQWNPNGFNGQTKNCNGWFSLGGYIVGIAPINVWSYGYVGGAGQLYGDDVIAWPAPGPIASVAATTYPGGIYNLTSAASINQWDISWVIHTYLYPNGFAGGPITLTNTYYTGSGSEGLSGVTTLRYAVVSGMIVILFDDDGIGHLSYTGDWNIPFDYQRRAAGYVTCGWPINVNGWVYFVDRGGKMFRTDGSYVLEIESPFSAKMIPEVAALATWPDTLANAENWMQFDQTQHRLVFNVKYLDGTVKSAGLAMINIGSTGMYGSASKAGAFQFLPDATNIGADEAMPRWETGGIKLGEPGNRTHIAYADLDVEVVGTPDAYSATPGAAIDLTSTGNDLQTIGPYGGYAKVVLGSYIDLGADTITFPVVHGLSSGDPVIYSNSGGAPIDPLLPHTTYYVIKADDYTIQLSASATVTSGTTWTLAVTDDFGGTFVDGPPAPVLTSGRQIIRCWLNQVVERTPRFRGTLNSPPSSVKCRAWGIRRIAFDQGGQLP